MNETEKKVVDDVASRLLSVAGAQNRDGFISKEDMRTVLATLAGQLGALLTANGTDETKGTNEAPAEEREHMSRAEAVRILMQLQAIEARCGHANINAALEMAISYIVKRHRDTCRNKAKRRAERMAEAATEV